MSDVSPGAEAPGRSRRRIGAVVTLTVALLPAVVAIWATPVFVTQDGPSHLYNAAVFLSILSEGAGSPYAPYYEVNWRPVPNWGGHAVLAGLLAVLPPRAADRAMTTLTLVGVAAAVLWLRRRVAVAGGSVVAALLSALLAMNMTWLMGFSGFLVGTILLVLTWGLWWGWRDRLGPARAAAIAAMLAVGYLTHLISLGLTAAGLLVLAVAAPSAGPRALRGRVGWTVAACSVLVPMALLYRSLSNGEGGLEPIWESLGPAWSPRIWARRLAWVDPIGLGVRDIAPLVGRRASPFVALAPVLWLGLALGIALATMLRRGRSAFGQGRGAWALLAALLLLGGAIGPDGIGRDHAYYVAQRLTLVGLIALVPALEVDPRRGVGAVVAALLLVALALQSAFIWDYAIESDRRAGAVARSAPAVGRGARIGTLVIEPAGGRFRSSPLGHADCLLGVGTGNVVWCNYEARHTFFPIRVRPDTDAPPSIVFEELVGVYRGPERARRWADVLDRHGEAIDVLIVWGRGPLLDGLNERWAGSGPAFESGPLRVYRRSPGPGATALPGILPDASAPPVGAAAAVGRMTFAGRADGSID